MIFLVVLRCAFLLPHPQYPAKVYVSGSLRRTPGEKVILHGGVKLRVELVAILPDNRRRPGAG